MSNFSFSHSVFKKLVSQGHQKVSLCGNGLISGSHLIVLPSCDKQDKVVKTFTSVYVHACFGSVMHTWVYVLWNFPKPKLLHYSESICSVSKYIYHRWYCIDIQLVERQIDISTRLCENGH